jgi:hypothetical protein
MARARNIKPGFFKDEDLADCGMDGRLLFAGLWTLADREGRLENRPRRIKAEVFPHDDDVDVPTVLLKLKSGGFISLYRVDGKDYIQIKTFKEHQNPHPKEQPSEIPPEPVAEKNGKDVTSNVLAVLIPSNLIPESPISESLSIAKPLSADADAVSDANIELIRKTYPRTGDNKKSREAIRKAVERERKIRGTRVDAARFLYRRALVFRGYTERWPPGDEQFIPLCTTWFNKERYNDEDSTYLRRADGNKADKRDNHNDNAEREALALLTADEGHSEVLPDGARPHPVSDGRKAPIEISARAGEAGD